MPLSAAELSALNTTKATKHGYWGKDKKATTQLCSNYQRWCWRQCPEGEEPDWLCEEWRVDLFRMVDDVIAVIGHRPPNRQLGRVHADQPMSPTNVAWVAVSPRVTRRQDKQELLSGVVRRTCLCDWSAEQDCRRSPRPCTWMANEIGNEVLDGYVAEVAMIEPKRPRRRWRPRT